MRFKGLCWTQTPARRVARSVRNTQVDIPARLMNHPFTTAPMPHKEPTRDRANVSRVGGA